MGEGPLRVFNLSFLLGSVCSPRADHSVSQVRTDERSDSERYTLGNSPMVRDICAESYHILDHPFHCWASFRTSRVLHFLARMRDLGGPVPRVLSLCPPPVSLADSEKHQLFLVRVNVCYPLVSWGFQLFPDRFMLGTGITPFWQFSPNQGSQRLKPLRITGNSRSP